MRLKSLQLIGFKTFAEKTYLEFPSDITCIVGPNGSGKSNIVDAIKWVLGEQSLKDLRSKTLEEVIFNGTEKEKPKGCAEVGLSLYNDDGKNLLPIEYTEVDIIRRIFRSGDSEYFINKTPCRLKDIQNLFLGTGLGRNTYSIITQGNVDLILSNKPEERRLIFDEAAGISKFKYRKKEILRNLEQVKNDLLRIKDIIKEVEDSLNTLLDQKTRAEEYKNLYSQIYNLEISLRKKQIELYSPKINELQKMVEEKDNNIVVKEVEIKNIDNDINNLKETINKIELSLDETEQKLNILKDKIDYYEKEVVINKERIDAKDNEIILINNEIENNYLLLTEIENKLKIIDEELKEEDNKLKEYDTIKDNQINNYQQITLLLEEENEKLNNIKNEATEIIRNKLNTKNELNYIIKLFNDKQKENINSELTKKNNLLEEYNLKKEKLKSLKEDLNNKLEKLNNNIENNAIIIKTIEKELDDITHEINELINKKIFINAKLEFLNLPIENIEGVEGRLIDKINVKDTCVKYAIEGIINNYPNALIVENHNIIKNLLSIKSNVTLLPLSSFENNDKKSNLLDSIDYDKKYENIINYILNNFTIVEDVEEALKLLKDKKQDKFVTKDGIIITNNFIKIIENMDKLLKEKEEIENLILYSKSIKQQKNEIKNKLEEERNNLIKEKEKIKEEIHNQTNNINLLTTKINTLKEEIEILKREKIDIDNELKKIIIKKEELTTTLKVYDEKEKQINDKFNNLKEKINKIEQTQRILKDNIQKLEMDKKIVLEKKELIMKNKEEYKSELERINSEITKRQQLINNINTDKENKMKIITQYWYELENLYEDYNIKRRKIDELIFQKINKKKEKEEKELTTKNYNQELMDEKIELNNIKFELNKLNLEINNIYKRLEEEYNIPIDKLYEIEQKEEIDDVNKAERKLIRLKNTLNRLGPVDLTSIDEYNSKKERYEFLKKQEQDLQETSNKLLIEIKEIEKQARSTFMKVFNQIQENFNILFKRIFGEDGYANLILQENTIQDNGDNDILDKGVEIEVQLPKKRPQSLTLLSGGERALVAIALIFAILKVNPPPFCILDEVDASLDDTNIIKFTELLKEFSKDTQFVVITHNKGTMKVADIIYGVTMEKEGISKLISMRLKEAEKLVE